ncbi:MAG: hypothetical protein U1F20_00190 [Lysobacterales bacterium]
MRTMTAIASALLLARRCRPIEPAQPRRGLVHDFAPADSCQLLSIPTTDTGVRPKATGFRNEGTTDQFVICGYGIPDCDARTVNVASSRS